jgi:hypothetical protein
MAARRFLLSPSAVAGGSGRQSPPDGGLGGCPPTLNLKWGVGTLHNSVGALPLNLKIQCRPARVTRILLRYVDAPAH